MSRLRDMGRGEDSAEGLNLAGKIVEHKVKLAAALAVIVLAVLVYAALHVGSVNSSGAKVVVEYYHSYACHICTRTTPQLEAAASEFGDRVELHKKCVTLLNEDSTKCILDDGLEGYERNMSEIRAIGARGTPAFLFNGRMVNKGMEKEEIINEMCSALYGIWGAVDFSGGKIEACR